VERAFPGAHSDVGGGYADCPEASYTPLRWMRDLALAHGAPLTKPLDGAVENYLRAPYAPVLHDESTAPMYFLDTYLPGYWLRKAGFPVHRRVFWNK